MALCLRVLVTVTLMAVALAGCARRRRSAALLVLAAAGRGVRRRRAVADAVGHPGRALRGLVGRSLHAVRRRRARAGGWWPGAVRNVRPGDRSGRGRAAALGWLGRPAPPGGWRALRLVPRADWWAAARRYREFPLLNTPHAFAGALQDTLAVALLVGFTGEAAAGFWGLALRYLKAPASLVGGAVSQALYPRLVDVSPADARAAVRRVMGTLALLALPLVLLLMLFGPDLFAAGVRRTLARGRNAGPCAGPLHRCAFRCFAARGGDAGLACPGLGAQARAGGAADVRRRAGSRAARRRAAGWRVGRVGGDAALLRLVLLVPGHVEARPRCACCLDLGSIARGAR